MNIKEEIEKIVKNVVKDSESSFLVEVPAEKKNGDYSSNVALVIANQLGKNPREVAEEIVAKIRNNKLFEKVEVAGPGFINFYLSENIFIDSLKRAQKEKNNFGKNQNLKGKKIIIEYTDPNILKDFHIGHLMSNAIGESISRILEFQSANVKRLCYQGDVGLHIAKAIFGKLKNQGKSWQESYVLGSKLYEEDEHAKKEIEKLNKAIYERSDSKINKIYDEGKKWSLEKFDTLYKVLGTKFDYLFFESQTASFGKDIVGDNIKNGIFEMGEKGAIIFKGEKVGLHTRVFINSEGLPTYEAKELGLAKIKYEKYRYDSSIIITANEQKEYFKVVFAALDKIFPDLAKKTRNITHGMMRLPEGKMSSRTGHVVTAESLINAAKEVVLKKINPVKSSEAGVLPEAKQFDRVKERDFSEEEKNEIAEKVTVGALKYSILKQSIGKDIIYDSKKALSFEGDSGPYLQYSLTRAFSLLQKAKLEKINPSLKKVPKDLSDLERMIHRFSEVVEKSGTDLEPHHIVVYLTELAGQFNSYYAKNKIVDKENKDVSSYRIALTEAFSIVMKNGLWLLGIPVLEKM